MTKMFKAKIQGLKNSDFVESGVWLTEEELELVLQRQYDDNKCDKIVHLGGTYFKPQDFRGVMDEKSLRELAQTDSPLFNSRLIESLAKSGHLGELVEIAPRGYNKLISNLVNSGKYQISSGGQVNKDGLDKLNAMKAKHRIGEGI